MGKLDPDFSGGISTSFRYRTLTLSASFNLNLGGKKFLYSMFQEAGLPSAYNNLPQEFVNRWTPENKDSDIPGIPGNKLLSGQTSSEWPKVTLPNNQAGYLYTMYNNSDVRVVNASFFRCNSISLSYTFPVEIARKLGMKNLSLSASVSNPFIIVSSEFKGMDPEVAMGNQPITRTYSLNLNVSF